jgi:RNA polymerase sigma factor (sigma-70 family)
MCQAESEDQAIEAIFQLCQGRLNRYLMNRFGYDVFEADWITSYTITALWENKTRLREASESALWAFLFRTACNQVIDRWRRERRFCELEEDFPLGERADPVEAAYERRDFFAAVEKLPDREKLVIQLMLEGFRGHEIAVRLHVSPACINQRYKKALELLRIMDCG